MLTNAWDRFPMLCAIYLGVGSITLGAQGLRSAPVREFVRTGPTAQLIRALVQSAHLEGVFGGVVGLESVDASTRMISVAASRTDMRTVLGTICDQDPAYQLVETDSPELVNLLAADQNARGHEILEFRIPRLDIEADEFTENLIGNLVDYSPALWDYLRGVYLRQGGRNTDPPGAVSGLFGNAKRPHFSIHLTNGSVRDALNAIALQSFQMYRAIGVDPRFVHTPDQLRVTPRGWEYRFLDPRGMSFYSWACQIFRAL